MFFSGNFLGVSSFQKVVGIPSPVLRSYTSVKVYGNATIDKLQIKNEEIDNTTLQNTAIAENLVWTPKTLLMAEFENNLIGGNVSGLDSPLTHWQVSRRESGSSILKNLGTVNVGVTEFIDYEAQPFKTYEYQINALNSEQVSEAFVTDEIDMNFYGYYLVSEDEGLAYKFDLNVKSGNNEYVEDIVIHDNYTQYPAISIGKRKYLKTSIQAICGEVDINGFLQQSVDYIDTLKDFVLNGKNKLWKTRKGGIHKVFTHNFKYQNLDDGIEQQIMIVSFDIVEVADV